MDSDSHLDQTLRQNLAIPPERCGLLPLVLQRYVALHRCNTIQQRGATYSTGVKVYFSTPSPNEMVGSPASLVAKVKAVPVIRPLAAI